MNQILKFRYSMLDTADFCYTKAKLQYIDLIPNPEQQSGDMLFGTAMHLVPETYFAGDDALQMFKDYWGAIEPDKYRWGRYQYDELSKIGVTLADKWLKGHAKHYAPLYTEQPIEFRLNGFTVTGTVDFIGKYKGVMSIVDFKTSAAAFPKEKAIVNSQMWLYTYGAQIALDIPVIEQVVYAPLIKYEARVQTPIVTLVTQELLTKHLDNATIMMRDLSTRTEWRRNEQNCLRCDYKTHCHGEHI